MGSHKKHKKEKKKKHKSRSRSPLEGEEPRERKRHHKKHKDRKKDRSPDVEEVPVDSHLLPPVPVEYRSTSIDQERERERDRSARGARSRDNGDSRAYDPDTSSSYHRDRADSYQREIDAYHREKEEEYQRKIDAYQREKSESYQMDEDAYQREIDAYHREKAEREKAAEASHQRDKTSDVYQKEKPVELSGGAQESMSIEETNRLRAKLGLKPLEVSEQVAEDGKLKDDLGEFYHRPAGNIAQQKQADKIRQKLDERREKRKVEKKLQATVTLAEGSDDEDAMAWIKKSREIEKQRQEADKRAALLDEMDLAFGVSELVAGEAAAERARGYGGGQLRGLRVAHGLDMLEEDRATILTLADKEVLAEDAEDVLVNVNLLDNERYSKNISERKKARAGYQAYDDEADLEAAALGHSRPVLAKYDDEIDKGAKDRQKGFIIGDDAAIEAKRFKDMMRRERLAGGANRRLESLALPPLRPAQQYYDQAEIEAKFKKRKKKTKGIRAKPKDEPIDVDDYDPNAVTINTDDTEVVPDALGAALAVDEEEVEPDWELQAAVARARRARLERERGLPVLPKVEELVQRMKQEEEQEVEPEQREPAIVLDATAEFCRTLGDIPTYGLAGNRDRSAEIMDFDREDLEPEPVPASSAWSRVDTEGEKPPDITAGGAAVLEPEPELGAGVAGALRLALSKGYLGTGTGTSGGTGGPGGPPPTAARNLLHAAHYSIEDKTHGYHEDDKHGRRGGGGYHGPLGEFREKTNFRPRVKLEYVDDEGRPLCPKEAFRYLSHKFHGKGPGKNKQEKRIKKQIQEGLMKKMSSTDTPLNTLHMLQQKQRETGSAHVLLQGGRRDQRPTPH